MKVSIQTDCWKCAISKEQELLENHVQYTIVTNISKFLSVLYIGQKPAKTNKLFVFEILIHIVLQPVRYWAGHAGSAQRDGQTYVRTTYQV